MAAALNRRRAQQQQQQAARGAAPAPPRPPRLEGADLVRFVALQHGGLVLCVLAFSLLAFGYDAGWMHSTHLSLLCLGLCLVGLFLHETRPVNREQEFKDKMRQQADAADNGGRQAVAAVAAATKAD